MYKDRQLYVYTYIHRLTQAQTKSTVKLVTYYNFTHSKIFIGHLPYV